MEGKGWIAIYGVLLLLTIYLFLAQQSQNARVKQLQADVASLKHELQQTEEPEEPVEEPSPSPEEDQGPDLSTKEARDKQRKVDLLKIDDALDEFRSKRGSFPKDLKELVPTPLSVIPKDPLSPKYNYRYLKTGGGFRLTAFLESDDPDDQKSDGKRDHIFTVSEKTP